MQCCPTCHTPLDHGEALAALAETLATGGMTYREAALAFGVSVKRIQNIVYERRLERRYRRIGSHPRRHAVITPGTFRELGQYLSRPRVHPAR